MLIMEYQIQKIAAIAMIDERLDELLEDYGDLPEQLKKKELQFNTAKLLVEETEGILKDIKSFCSKTKVTLMELKDQEEKLSKQQFLVRNNKEFDAITHQINEIKTRHEQLSDKLRTEGVKEENLRRILEQQTREMDVAHKELEETYEDVKQVAGDQNEEVAKLQVRRKEIMNNISIRYIKDYDRIRTIHRDSAVYIRKNSCSGCFSAVPAQLMVEVRNNPDKLYFCENCGRILLPDDMEMEFDEIYEN